MRLASIAMGFTIGFGIFTTYHVRPSRTRHGFLRILVDAAFSGFPFF
jgi:hypothetical protein